MHNVRASLFRFGREASSRWRATVLGKDLPRPVRCSEAWCLPRLEDRVRLHFSCCSFAGNKQSKEVGYGISRRTARPRCFQRTMKGKVCRTTSPWPAPTTSLCLLTRTPYYSRKEDEIALDARTGCMEDSPRSCLFALFTQLIEPSEGLDHVTGAHRKWKQPADFGSSRTRSPLLPRSTVRAAAIGYSSGRGMVDQLGRRQCPRNSNSSILTQRPKIGPAARWCINDMLVEPAETLNAILCEQTSWVAVICAWVASKCARRSCNMPLRPPLGYVH